MDEYIIWFGLICVQMRMQYLLILDVNGGYQVCYVHFFIVLAVFLYRIIIIVLFWIAFYYLLYRQARWMWAYIKAVW